MRRVHLAMAGLLAASPLPAAVVTGLTVDGQGLTDPGYSQVSSQVYGDSCFAGGLRLGSLNLAHDAQHLYIGIQGNLEYDSIYIFLDTRPGGAAALDADVGFAEFDELASAGGGVMPTGFSPFLCDYAFNLKSFETTLSRLDVQAGTASVAGANWVPGVSQDGYEVAINNSNTFASDQIASNAPGTGIEIKIPLSEVGDPALGEFISLFVVAGNSNNGGEGGAYMTNQVLPPDFANSPPGNDCYGRDGLGGGTGPGVNYNGVGGPDIQPAFYELGQQLFFVDNTFDESDGDFSPGDLSLREAIEQANASGLPSRLLLPFGGANFQLTSALPTATAPIELFGNITNPSLIVIDGKLNYPILAATGTTFAARGLTFKDGRALGFDGGFALRGYAGGGSGGLGGGLLLDVDAARLQDVVFLNCTAQGGRGGTQNLAGTATTISGSGGGGLGGPGNSNYEAGGNASGGDGGNRIRGAGNSPMPGCDGGFPLLSPPGAGGVGGTHPCLFGGPTAFGGGGGGRAPGAGGAYGGDAGPFGGGGAGDTPGNRGFGGFFGGDGGGAANEGGGGGAGVGGGLFVRGGEVELVRVHFQDNDAVGGDGRGGPGTMGQGKGAGFFAFPGATIRSIGSTFTNNNATNSSGGGFDNGVESDTNDAWGTIEGNYPSARPFMQITSANPPADGIARIEVVFTQDVTGVDVTDFRLLENIARDGGATGRRAPVVTEVQGSGSVYTVLVDSGGDSGVNSLELLDDDTIVDAVTSLPLNGPGTGEVAAQSDLFFFNNLPPTVEISDFNITSPRSTQPDEIFVDFSEPVNNFGLEDFTLTRDGNPVTFTQGPGTIVSDNGFGFITIQDPVYGSSADGAYVLTLNPSDIVDNQGVPLAVGDTISWTLDATGPAAQIEFFGSDPSSAQIAEFLVTFSEPATQVPGMDVEAITTDSLVFDFISVQEFEPTVWGVSVNFLEGQGDLSIRIPAGAFVDAAGNPSQEANTSPIRVDRVGPSLQVLAQDFTSPTSASQLEFQLLFDEPVDELQVSELVITPTGTVTIGSPPNLEGVSASEYALTLSNVSGDGSIQLSIPAGVVQDGLAQGNLASDLFIFVIDNSNPTASLPYFFANPTQDPIIRINVNASEDVAALVLGDFDVATTGTLTIGTSELLTQNPGRNYQLVYSGLEGAGTLQATLRAGELVDLAGNVSTQAFQSVVITKRLPAIVVGEIEVDPTNVTVTDLGGGNYDLTAGALLDGNIRIDAPIQIRGNTITGNGPVVSLFDAAQGQTLINTSFSVDGTTALLTKTGTGPNPFTYGGVPLNICSIGISGGAASLSGSFVHPKMTGSHFSGLGIQDSGIFGFDAQLRVGGSPCSTGGSQLVFELVATAQDGQGILISGPSPGSNIGGTSFFNISSLRINSNGTTAATGSFTKSGFSFAMNGFSTAADGFIVSTASRDIDFTPTEFLFNLTDVKFGTNGTAISAAGGNWTSGNAVCTFESPVFGPNFISCGDVTIPTTTAFGDVTVEGVVLSEDESLGANDSTLVLQGVRLGFEEGGFNQFAFSADAPALISTGIVDFDFDSASITRDSVNITGGNANLAGLMFGFSIAPTEEPPDGLVYSGNLTLPGNLLGASAGGTVTVIGDTVNLDAINFCTPTFSIPGEPGEPDPGAAGKQKPKVKGANFDLPQICFSYEGGPPEIFEGSLTVALPGLFAVNGSLRVLNGLLDAIGIEVSDLNKPIGNTGAFLQSLGASVSNLSRQRTTWVETYYAYNPAIPDIEPVTVSRNGVPPVKIEGTVGATAGPEVPVLDVALIAMDAKVAVDETQFRVDGTVTVVILETGGGFVHIRWSGIQKGIAAGGYMIYQLVIRGDIKAFLDFAGFFAGCASVQLCVPDFVPVFAGICVGGVRACLAFPPFSIKGCLVTFLGDICLTIDEDGVSVGKDALGRDIKYESWEKPHDMPVALPFGEVNKTLGTQNQLYMRVMTNFSVAEKLYQGEGDFLRSARASEQTFLNLPTNGGPVFIQLNWQNAGVEPDWTVTTPQAEIITTADGLFTVDPDTAPGAYVGTPELGAASFGIKDPQFGQYIVEINNPEEIGAYSTTILTQNAPPFARITSASVAGSTLNFGWFDLDADDNAEVTIWLDGDRQDENGQFLAGPFLEDDDASDFTSHDLAANPIPSGLYWPYIKIDDGANAPYFEYTRDPIFIPEVDAPPVVENVQISGVNNTISVSFDPVDDPDVVSYKLVWTEDVDSGFFTNGEAIPLGESEALIGGFENGKPYRFALTAMRFLTTEEGTRAAKHAVLDDASPSVAFTGNLRRGDDIRAAKQAIAQRALDAGVKLEPADELSLAQQAVMVSKYNAVWEREGENSPEFQEFVANSRLASRNKARPRVEEETYTESFVFFSDTIVIRGPFGSNNPPEFGALADGAAKLGETYARVLEAVDPEGDTVTYSLVSGPEGMLVAPNGSLIWDPAGFAKMDYEVTVAAEDPSGARSEAFFRIAVVDGLTPPPYMVITTPEKNIFQGQTFIYDIDTNVTSPTSDERYFFREKPEFSAQLDAITGVITWTVPLDYSGPAQFIVRVAEQSDGFGREAFQVFTIDVETQLDELDNIGQDLDQTWMVQ